MANTLNGVNMARIADLSLDALITEMFPLRSFATDFSDEVSAPTQTITSRIPTQPTVQDMTVNKTPGNSVLTAVTITLNNFWGVVLGFTDLERTYTDKDLIAMFIKPAVVALFEKVIATVNALVLNANYPTNAVYAATALDADAVATIAGTMSGLKVPKSPRALLIPPAYFANLTKDNAIQAAYAFGDDGVIKDNRIERLHGFDIINFNGTIPTNSENLAGYAFHPSALCIAARTIVEPPPGTWYGQVANVTDPDSGLTLQVREYYNGVQLVYELALLWGVQIGQANSLLRIKSA